VAKSLRLLLLDANVVIELHRLRLWSAIIDRCEVLLASVVVEESRYHEAGEIQTPLDLRADIAAKNVTVVEPELVTIQAFRRRFRPTFLERLDAGEAESLAYLSEIDGNCLIASADKIVWRTLGALSRGEQGVSLEEILNKIGMTKSLDHEFSKAYREHWTKRGFEEGIRGEALS